MQKGNLSIMEEFDLRSQILLGEDSTRQFKREPSADAKMAGGAFSSASRKTERSQD